MAKDKRYDAVQSLIEAKRIQRFSDIFEYIPKTIVARDLRLNYRSFVSKVNAPERFTVKEITRMADMLEVPDVRLFEMIAGVRAPVIKGGRQGSGRSSDIPGVQA